MGDMTKDSLKESLLKLQCHFTWNLYEEGLDIHNIEDRLYEQITFSPYGNKHRMYNLLAYLKHLKGDNDEAILQLQKAETLIQESGSMEDLDVKRIVTYGNYAWVFYQQNQLTKSCTYVNKVENILKQYESPPMQNILLLEIHSEKGWTYFIYPDDRYEQAEESFGKALKIDPENPDLNSGYAIIVYRIEIVEYSRNTGDRSVPLLQRAVQLNPKDVVVKSLLALKYQYLKNFDHGETLIKEALREGSECPFVLRYVAIYYRRKEMNDEAIAMLKKALKLTPQSASLHYQLGICYTKEIKMINQRAREAKLNHQPIYSNEQQKTDAILSAIFYLKRAIELKTTFVTAHIVLARVYVQARKYQKAEETFNKTLSIKSINLTEKQELHHSWACYEMFTQKSESKAIMHWKEAIMIKRQSLFRGYAIEDLKNLAQTMIAKKPVNPTGYGLLGFIHQQEGQDKLASEYYKKALQLEPSNQEYLEALSTLESTFACLSDN